uniref:Quinone oxidoreductase-like protein 1 n=1 Tax=Taeniopygia guttata TaxID=59729 RepID=A0A674H1Z4_TAEGU
ALPGAVGACRFLFVEDESGEELETRVVIFGEVTRHYEGPVWSAEFSWRGNDICAPGKREPSCLQRPRCEGAGQSLCSELGGYKAPVRNQTEEGTCACWARNFGSCAGSKVTFFQPDDEVVGILPLDSEESGVCEIILVHEHYLVHKPEKVCWAEAAGTVRDGLRAYTALHYLAQVSPGTSVLVLDGASPFGTIAIQLAQHRGAKVISTAHSLEDKQYLERLRPAGGVRQPLVARVIDVSHGKIDVAESCLEETGGLGVDIVLDAGVRLYSAEDEPASKSQLLPHKHDIITLLGVGGRWITTERNLQLDPPDSHSLFLKGATVSFLNDEIWNLSNVQQGKYLNILWWPCLSWMNRSHCMKPKFLWK